MDWDTKSIIGIGIIILFLIGVLFVGFINIRKIADDCENMSYEDCYDYCEEESFVKLISCEEVVKEQIERDEFKRIIKEDRNK